MNTKTPDEVLRTVSSDFKRRGETHKSAAQKMGYKSKQTLSNLLSSKKYMSGFHAKKFADTFGYNEEFLTTGKGELLSTANASEDQMRPAALYQPTAEERYQKMRADAMQAHVWLVDFLSLRKDNETLAFLRLLWKFFSAESLVRADMRRNGIDESQFGVRMEEFVGDTLSLIMASLADESAKADCH